MRYNKLVRDKVLKNLEAKGIPFTSHIADKTEYWNKLKEKLVEEVAEFVKDENIEEIADILEVLNSIIEHKHFDRAEIEKTKSLKIEQKGGFKKRIILEES